MISIKLYLFFQAVLDKLVNGHTLFIIYNLTSRCTCKGEVQLDFIQVFFY